jgi:hypothetical protein
MMLAAAKSCQFYGGHFVAAAPRLTTYESRARVWCPRPAPIVLQYYNYLPSGTLQSLIETISNFEFAYFTSENSCLGDVIYI